MAVTNTGENTFHFATSTTAATWGPSTKVRQVRVTNRGTTAGDVIYVNIATGGSAAAAEANIVTAVAAADETFAIMPGQTKVVWLSTRASWIAGSIIAAANTPAASIECTDWYGG